MRANLILLLLQGVRRDPYVPRREVRPRAQNFVRQVRGEDPAAPVALLPGLWSGVGRHSLSTGFL